MYKEVWHEITYSGWYAVKHDQPTIHHAQDMTVEQSKAGLNSDFTFS